MKYTVIDTPAAKLPYAANKNVQQLKSLLPVINAIHKELEPFEEDMALYVLRTLYIARGFLNNQKEQRKDPTADDYIAVTWNWYCQSLGLCRKTANNWLKNFTPAEFSEDDKDHIQLDRIGNGFWRLLSRLYCGLERDAFGFLPQASRPAVPACEIPELQADQNAGDTEALTSDSDMQQLRELLSTISLTRKDIEPFEEEMALYIFRLLYKTRAVLTDSKWQRKDPAAANYLPFTWHGYCQWIGVSRKTMEAWLNYFTPAELSEDGKDHILIGAVRKAFWGTLVWSFCILESNAVCILHHASRRTGLVPECEQDEEE